VSAHRRLSQQEWLFPWTQRFSGVTPDAVPDVTNGPSISLTTAFVIFGRGGVWCGVRQRNDRLGLRTATPPQNAGHSSSSAEQ
jgi:hypothetical protein